MLSSIRRKKINRIKSEDYTAQFDKDESSRFYREKKIFDTVNTYPIAKASTRLMRL
jgi:hypothetical protein